MEVMAPPKDEKTRKEKRPNLKRRQYDDSALEAAFGDIIERGMSIRAAAGKHGIPEATIQHKLSGKRALESKPGPKPLFSMSEEQLLVNNIMNAQRAACPVTKGSVMTAVKCILEEEAAKGIERKRPPSFTGDKPGQKWWTLFRKRHPNLNFCSPETSDYSELHIPYTQLDHASTCYQGVDLGGFKEVSVQTQPQPHISRASQTESIMNTELNRQRLRRLKYDRSLCDMVLEYAGYAPLLDMYLSKPFSVEELGKEFLPTQPRGPGITPELGAPQHGLGVSEGEDQLRCLREDGPRCSWENKPRCFKEEDGPMHSREKRPKYSGDEERLEQSWEEDRARCSEDNYTIFRAASVQVSSADVSSHF